MTPLNVAVYIDGMSLYTLLQTKKIRLPLWLTPFPHISTNEETKIQ